QYDLLNIRYLVLPSDRQPPVKATLIARQGRHTLWQVDTSGYLDVVDTVYPPIVADHSNIGSQTTSFLTSTNLASKHYQWIAFGGTPAADPTLAFAVGRDTPAGSVQLEQSAL